VTDNGMQAFFTPKSIAVVGASNNPDKPGSTIVENLFKIGFEGAIIPVNPKEEEVHGLKCFSGIDEIPEEVELLVLITPSGAIDEVMQQVDKRMASRNDIKGIICAAAGYGEINTEEGNRRERTLLDTANKWDIRVIGPNCIGVIDNANRVDTTFVETLMPEELRGEAGGLSFISQSGAVAASLLMWGASLASPLKFNKFLSIGNMGDVDFIDLLDYLEKDPVTEVIALYLEGYPQAGKLLKTMERIAKKKPVIVLKVGRSEAGAKAASSHTGSLAGEDVIYDNLFKQFGIIRVGTLEELMDTMQAFSIIPLPRGNQTFLLSQAGGPGIIGTDALSFEPQLSLAKISQTTKQKLKEELVPFATVCNPEGVADITASATVAHHVNSLEMVLEDINVDAVIFITVVPTFLPKVELGKQVKELLEKWKDQKPVFPVIMAGKWVEEVRTMIGQANYMTFETPERAVKVLGNMVDYYNFQNQARGGSH